MAEITKLVPRLKINIKPRHNNLKQNTGPHGRIEKMKISLTNLFKFERIEMYFNRCNEVRGYAERLITEAIRHGDKHPSTMDMANFYLEDKQMVHKLFKVFVPRYANYQTSYTDMHLIPKDCTFPKGFRRKYFPQECVLELKGNPYPAMPRKAKPSSQSLTNILLKEAGKEFRKMKLKSEPEK